ncbi:hypothetical protein CO613_01025 [Lysobacteraceae bacterium NML07-0707]|nr:hypothetical protein CO613_01025 [Xanthomonadaceae bacterium NML07-0707]
MKLNTETPKMLMPDGTVLQMTRAGGRAWMVELCGGYGDGVRAIMDELHHLGFYMDKGAVPLTAFARAANALPRWPKRDETMGGSA